MKKFIFILACFIGLTSVSVSAQIRIDIGGSWYDIDNVSGDLVFRPNGSATDKSLTLSDNGTFNATFNGLVNLYDVGVGAGAQVLQVDGEEALWFNGTYFSWGFDGTANYFARNIGVGITAPLAKFHAKGTGNLIRMSSLSGNGWMGFYSGAADNVLEGWVENFNDNLNITSQSGELWLRTTTSGGDVRVITNGILDVETDKIKIDDASNKYLEFYNGATKTGHVSSLTNNNMQIEPIGGGIYLNSDDRINFNVGTGASSAITDAGDMGVGTTSPTAKLDVVGNAVIRGTNVTTGSDAGSGIANVTIGGGRALDGQSSFQLVADESVYSDWGVKFARFGNGFSRFTHRGTNAFQFMSSDASNIGFLTNSALRMTIEHTTGDVGIGTSNPTSRLHVAGDIFATGTITSSDRRLKRDIDEYSAGLDEVMKLRPVSYFYNGEAGIRTDLKHVGLIAQELEAIQPELVGEYLYQNTDMWDNVTEEGTYKYIQEGAIKYMLVNAIQEQQTQMEERDAEMEALQLENAEMQAQLAQLTQIVLKLQQNCACEETEVKKTSKDVTLTSEQAPYLEQNQPNPFIENTVIKYFLPEGSSNAGINVYTAEGRLFKTIKISEAGHGQVNITANSLPAGNYIYQLISDNGIVDSKTMVLQ